RPNILPSPDEHATAICSADSAQFGRRLVSRQNTRERETSRVRSAVHRPEKRTDANVASADGPDGTRSNADIVSREQSHLTVTGLQGGVALEVDISSPYDRP